MMLRIASLEINGPNFATTQDTTSPASLDRCDAGNSFVQKSITCGSVTYFSLLFTNSGSMRHFGISINVPPAGSDINNNAQLRKMCSKRGPTIPVCPGSYNPYSILIASCTKKSFWSGVSNSNIFKPIGFVMSAGLKYIISSTRSFGTLPRRDSTKSPCGSINAKPRPSIMS